MPYFESASELPVRDMDSMSASVDLMISRGATEAEALAYVENNWLAGDDVLSLVSTLYRQKTRHLSSQVSHMHKAANQPQRELAA